MHDVSNVTFFVHLKPEKDLMMTGTDIYNFARQIGERGHDEDGKPTVTLASVGFDWEELAVEQQNRLSYLSE